MNRPLSTPVIIGRDDLLALGRRRLEGLRSGAGHLLFLAGEAGIGKTRLLGSITREATHQETRVVSAGATPGDLEVPGALFMELGHALSIEDEEGRPLGRTILDELAGDDAQGGSARRRRRMLVMTVADAVRALASTGPVLLALEDLHWADELTLEILARLAQHLDQVPLLVVGTYRSDELYPRIPMREWRSRLLTQRLAEEARLTRLSPVETERMASMLLGGDLPAPRELTDAVYRRSDGIPLHVEELMAAMDASSPAGMALPVPDTLTDAILVRRAALGAQSAAVAEAAAVIARSFDLELLATVTDEPMEVVAAALVELEERHLIVPSGPARWYAFRHALIRDTLEAAVPLDRRRALHERVARTLVSRPSLADAALVSAHFEAAGLSADAYVHAVAAAESAARLSSHREALELYRRAIRCAPPSMAGDERAQLLAACAIEEAAADDNRAAAATYERARQLLLDADQPAMAAALVPPLAAARHLVGDPLEARVGLLRDGLAELAREPALAADADETAARLYAGLAAAYMLDRRLEEGAEHAERAIALASEAGDVQTGLDALTTLGSILVFAGRMDDGWSALEESVRQARDAGFEAEAARAYRMIGTSASVLVEYERGERWLREGIEYAERTEQWNHRHYMAAHLGHVLWATGAWADAAAVTERALADGRGGITTRITALHVLGYLALGRGRWETAATTLNEALTLGQEMNELQRFSPAQWGLAEAALLEGRHRDAVDLTEAGYRASAAVRDAAYLFPFLVTGTRARLASGDISEAERWLERVEALLGARPVPGALPAIDHARGLLAMAKGRTGAARRALEAARDAWTQRRRTWESAWAALDLARCALRTNRPADASALASSVGSQARQLGSEPLGAAALEIERLVRRRGVGEERWAPLTAREFEVASLIAEGRTNRAIAEALVITPKTVASHVEHILARLGAERRTEIAAWVAAVRDA